MIILGSRIHRIMQEPVPDKPRAIKKTIASVAIAGFLFFAVGFAALHFLRADLDPKAHYGSEYAIGPYGLLMQANFVMFGLGLSALGMWLLQNAGRSRVVALGSVLLFVASVGLFIDAVVPTDPLGAPETPTGGVHNTVGALVFLSLAVAFQVLTLAFRKQLPWKGVGAIAPALAVASLASFLAFPLSQGSGVTGLVQRVALVCYIAWLLQFTVRLCFLRPAPRPSGHDVHPDDRLVAGT